MKLEDKLHGKFSSYSVKPSSLNYFWKWLLLISCTSHFLTGSPFKEAVYQPIKKNHKCVEGRGTKVPNTYIVVVFNWILLLTSHIHVLKPCTLRWVRLKYLYANLFQKMSSSVLGIKLCYIALICLKINNIEAYLIKQFRN